MGFKLTITGQNTTIQLGEEVIKSVEVNTSTENSVLAKTNIVATMSVNGKLLSNNRPQMIWKPKKYLCGHWLRRKIKMLTAV